MRSKKAGSGIKPVKSNVEKSFDRVRRKFARDIEQI